MSGETTTGEPRKIGVFICQCGGNISDFVDTEKVRESAEKDPRVVVAQVHMFACSDAGQQCIVQAIREKKLDGIVVASCSPKLHLGTFRAAAQRAGLNPYQYTQANIREQCSWAHTHDRAGATEKATTVVEAGVAHTAFSRPLERLRAPTLPHALVIGAGVAGLRSALALSAMGIAVTLVEKVGGARRQRPAVGEALPERPRGPRAGLDPGRRGPDARQHHALHERRAHREGGPHRRVHRPHPRRRVRYRLPEGRGDPRHDRFRAGGPAARGVRPRPRWGRHAPRVRGPPREEPRPDPGRRARGPVHRLRLLRRLPRPHRRGGRTHVLLEVLLQRDHLCRPPGRRAQPERPTVPPLP